MIGSYTSWRVEYLGDTCGWIVLDTYCDQSDAITFARMYADDESCKTRIVEVETREQVWSEHDSREEKP